MIRSLIFFSSLALWSIDGFLPARTLSMSMEQSRTGVINRPAFIGRAAAAVATVSLAVQPSLVQADPLPRVGSKAPDFTLPSNDNGKKYSLSDLLSTGKTTVLYTYPGDFTSGCTIEANAFQKDIERYRAINAQVVGMSVDSPEKHLDFKKKYGLDFVLLSDIGAVTADKYGAKLEIPYFGKFANRFTYIIAPDGIIMKIFTDVDSHVADHSKEVLSYLESQKA